MTSQHPEAQVSMAGDRSFKSMGNLKTQVTERVGQHPHQLGCMLTFRVNQLDVMRIWPF